MHTLPTLTLFYPPYHPPQRLTEVTLSLGSDDAVVASRLGVTANVAGYEGVLTTANDKALSEPPQGHMHAIDAVLAIFDLSGGSCAGRAGHV